ncbi:MAG: hypothetical protein ACXVYV_02050 [Gaiellales bacterium]
MGDAIGIGGLMGLLDKLKQQATEVASTVAEKTQETARVGQLQIQLRNLKGEEKEALADLGREAYRLHTAGSLGSVSDQFTALAAAVSDVQRRIAEKEVEIAQVRSDGDGQADTVEGEAEEVVEPSPAADQTTTT